jgi:hypothetical protein
MPVGAVLMSVSTIVVALNAQLLRRLDLRPGAGPSSATGRWGSRPCIAEKSPGDARPSAGRVAGWT